MARVRDELKEGRWRRLLQEKVSSVESVASFCEKRRIPVHQFYWWQRKLSYRGRRAARRQPSQPPQFVPVRVPIARPSIDVIHPSGCVVRVTEGVDPHLLRNVFGALQREEA